MRPSFSKKYENKPIKKIGISINQPVNKNEFSLNKGKILIWT